MQKYFIRLMNRECDLFTIENTYVATCTYPFYTCNRDIFPPDILPPDTLPPDLSEAGAISGEHMGCRLEKRHTSLRTAVVRSGILRSLNNAAVRLYSRPKLDI